jgi:hypothetical protein
MRTEQEWRKNRFEEGPSSGEIDGRAPPGRDGRCDGAERTPFDKPPCARTHLFTRPTKVAVQPTRTVSRLSDVGVS